MWGHNGNKSLYDCVSILICIFMSLHVSVRHSHTYYKYDTINKSNHIKPVITRQSKSVEMLDNNSVKSSKKIAEYVGGL